MTLPAFLEPENARIAIPVALAVGYACYHLWHWRKTHRKAGDKRESEPAATAGTAASPKPAEERIPERQKTPEASRGRKPQPVPVRAANGNPPASGEPVRYPHYADDTSARETGSHGRGPLERLYQKARAGDAECYVSLGEHAWGRGALVEAHFWISLAKFNGVKGLDEWLRQIRMCWIQAGRLPEPENVYDQFPLDRSALAHAWIMLAAGFNAHVNRDLIAKMERDGSPDAKLILASVAR